MKEGDSIAADVRMIYVSNFEVDEALLTGESLPVKKEIQQANDMGTHTLTTCGPDNDY
jgi:magnesium-transporting ATPase (P-type)